MGVKQDGSGNRSQLVKDRKIGRGDRIASACQFASGEVPPGTLQSRHLVKKVPVFVDTVGDFS
jgi:hypothetical protein